MIDALDECDDDRDVQLILRILSEAEILDHIQFRAFLTSRPSVSVRGGFLETDYQNFILHEIEQYFTRQDLRIFFEIKLEDIRKTYGLTVDFPGEGDVETLVQRAGGLFIYAATICLFLGKGEHPPPRERLKTILKNEASAVSALEDLDQLYTKILQEALPKTKSTNSKEHKREFCRHFTVVAGSVVSLFSSLSVSSLANLLSLEQDDINFTLNSLWSIISVPQKSNATISLLHPSFRDFLLDQTRCTDLDFWVDSAERHVGLTGSCLKFMAGSLKRDICDLKMPETLINEIFPERIQEHITAELEYACTYWVRHLESSVPSQTAFLNMICLIEFGDSLSRASFTGWKH